MKKPIRRPWSVRKISDRIRRGYGQGEVANYIPWIGVRDLSSKGTSTRMWSPKTGRTMQFLSNIERDAFLVAEFREDFVDYWEQWPLERRWTQWAAEKLRYRHPIYIGTRIPVVMTVDGVLTLRKGSEVVRKAIDCKHSSDLHTVRIRQKLAITQLACKQLKLPHLVATEKTHNPQVVKNILWVRMAVEKSGEVKPVKGAFDMWPMRMHRHLSSHQTDAAFSRMTVSQYCRWFQTQHGLSKGLGLRCIKLLMWQRLVDFDLATQAPEKLVLRDLAIRSVPSAATSRSPLPA